MDTITVTTEISVDLYSGKVNTINAKQNDARARYVLATCYNNGELCQLNAEKHTAFLRFKKRDGAIGCNICTITEDGKVKFELTRQLLAVSGLCVADLFIVGTGEESISNVSSVRFYINVVGCPYAEDEMESTDEFTAFEYLIQKVMDSYNSIVANAETYAKAAQSYAQGGTQSRYGEDTDNAKYYYTQILQMYNELKK